MSSTERERQRTKCEGGGGPVDEKQRHSFDLQMRLTKRLPSVSLPPGQAKNNGSTLGAQRKSCVRQEIRQENRKRLRAVQRGSDLQYDNENGLGSISAGFTLIFKIKTARDWKRLARDEHSLL